MGTSKRERQKAARQQRLESEAEASVAQRQRRRTINLIAAIVVGLIVVFGLIWLLSGDDDGVDTTTPTTGDPADDAEATNDATPAAALLSPGEALPTECPDGSERRIDFDAAPPMCLYEGVTYTAVFDTSEGEVRVELDTTNTPLTANNFATLARWGYYDDTLVHRTAPSIDIIQGGSPHTQNSADQGPGYALADEGNFRYDAGPVADYTYSPGDLAMARVARPDGAGAQYFFVTGENGSLLDGGPDAVNGQGSYVVFGRTDDAGIAITDAILDLHDPATNAPNREVIVNTVTIEES